MAIDDLTLYDKNHIMSRIEKFLFAICSLDSSDLPIPLSRIEELYNCLVTGDTPPTFDPLSRAEKFLMACLGGYDINKLPEPLSRSEVLLKKIATGDNNLEDVDNLQSKYEFLLAYIIQNGGIGGIDSDISYMKYTLTEKETTLYNTKERSVRSAILKGQTLVNLIDYSKTEINTSSKYIQLGGMVRRIVGITVTVINNSNKIIRAQTTENEGGTFKQQINIEANTKKRIVLEANERLARLRGTQSDGWTVNESGLNEIKITTMVIEGDYTNIDISYFEGMTSVKMPVLTTTGKNLFNKNNIIVDGYIISNGNLVYETGDNRNASDFIEVEPNCLYRISGIKNSAINGARSHQYVGMYDKNKRFISSTTIYCLSDSATFTTTENTKYIRVSVRNDDINRLQIEKGTNTTYEPHKSNILTCNEEVTLRGIGEVKDELNLVTGELTQSLVERVFDGTEKWIIGGTGDNYKLFRCETYTDMSKASSVIVSDKYAYSTLNNAGSNLNITFSTTTGKPCIVTSQVDLSLDDFKSKLSVDKPRVQYQLAEKVVKTVDLSIVDQDGNNTKLSTFDDITYVTLSSEGLIPEAELEVATKNEEVLNTLSLEMEDISTAQTTLEETSNTQSENVDVTMIATTEIYEGLL